MSKFNRIMTIVYVVIAVMITSTIIASAATGTDVVTYIKEIIENHLYFVDDVEVTEDEFNTVVNGEHTETIEKTVEHRVYTETVYKINGEVVSASDYTSYISNNSGGVIVDNKPVVNPTPISSNTIVITQNSLTPMNCGSLGDYLEFTTDPYGNVLSAVVKSDKVQSVTYTYNSDTYLTYTTQDAENNYYYIANTDGVVYQDISNGFYFRYGKPTLTAFYVCNSDHQASRGLSVGDTVFEIEYNDNIAPITFGFIFDSITLTLSK